MKTFRRKYLLKILIGFVSLQLVIFLWVENRNHRPIATNDEIYVFEGHSIKFRPLINDSDEDKDEINIQDVAEPKHGNIIRESDLLVYTVGNGFVGVDSFSYTISDGDKVSELAYIKVTVKENLKPVANPDNVQLYRGNEMILRILGNDEDMEGDSIFINEFSNPVYGQLTKHGNEFVYTIDNNSAQKDSFQYTISDGFSLSEKAIVNITIKDKNDPIYPWLSTDVGNPAIQGDLIKKGDKYIVSASGSDIWGKSDHFNFIWQTVNGDCEIYTKIESIENTDPWAKAGIMIRETLIANSKNALLAITSENGLSFQGRKIEGDGSIGFCAPIKLAAPYWVKLTRKDNDFIAYISPDGTKWTETGKTTINMSASVYVGLAVTSHNDEKLCAVCFSSTKINLK